MAHIYKLIDPICNDIRYIGKTTQPLEERLEEHIYESLRYKETAKHIWIQELADKGLRPVIKSVQQCQEMYLDQAERFFIRSYLASGHNLLNLILNPDRENTFTSYYNGLKTQTCNELTDLLKRNVDPVSIYSLYKKELEVLFKTVQFGFIHNIPRRFNIKDPVEEFCILLYLESKGNLPSVNVITNKFDDPIIRPDFIKYILGRQFMDKEFRKIINLDKLDCILM